MENNTKKKLHLPITPRQFLLIFAADILYAVALNMFYVDNKIAAGGLAGIATVINSFIPIPIGAAVLVMSVPIVLVSFKVKGIPYTLMALFTTALYSVCIDLLAFLPCASYDKLVAVICGGILYGFAASLAIKARLSSGGTDLLAKLLITKFKHLSLGTLYMLIDGVIVVCAGIAFRDISAMIYAILAIATCSVITDLMNKGFNKAQMFLIFASKNQEAISNAILQDLHHGVTALRGTGKYSNNDRDILLAVVTPAQSPRLKEIVAEQDPDAFVILVSANEIIGEGFENTRLTETVKDQKRKESLRNKAE